MKVTANMVIFTAPLMHKVYNLRVITRSKTHNNIKKATNKQKSIRSRDFLGAAYNMWQF